MALALVLVIGYFIPLTVAILRHHNVTGVAIVSLLLGWTVVGWIIALVMACGAQHKTVIINQAAPSGELVPRFDPYTGQPLLPPASPTTPATPTEP